MAQVEDEGLSKNEESLSEEIVFVNKEGSFGHNGLTRWSEDKCLLG